MKLSLKNEFVFQLIALLVSFIVVHAIYIGLVRPQAQIILDARDVSVAAGNFMDAERSLWVVLKDFEQEACFVLAFWAIAIMGFKAKLLTAEKKLLGEPLIQVPTGARILPEDARSLSRVLESLPGENASRLLPRALRVALRRLEADSGIHEISAAVRDVCESESQRLDTELAMIRYIAWAIPSIGFIGTVRGIGSALANAHEAVQGNIAGVTASLGVAFNSTFIALLISIFLMFLSHQLTLHQERLVLDANRYCDNNLVKHIQV